LKGTPAKASRAEFEKAYFGGDPSYSKIAKEFYEDYLASKYNLKQYIKATTSSVE
jgi:hypothetical protein